jgi:hypothetical protein
LLAGLVLGERFPDVDQHVGFLVHRSVLTHGLLLPVLFYGLAVGTRATRVRLFAAGFSAGVGVHLCYDLFPKAWAGYALIHVPSAGWTYPVVSWLWIALSITCCLYLAMRLGKNGVQSMAVVLGALGMFAYAGVDEDRVWGPALSMMAATFVGLAMVLRRRSPENR